MRNPFRHRHAVKPVRVQHLMQAPQAFLGPTSSEKIPTTIVLYVCTCGAAESRILSGTWTMADILGQSPADAVGELIGEPK